MQHICRVVFYMQAAGAYVQGGSHTHEQLGLSEAFQGIATASLVFVALADPRLTEEAKLSITRALISQRACCCCGVRYYCVAL